MGSKIIATDIRGVVYIRGDASIVRKCAEKCKGNKMIPKVCPTCGAKQTDEQPQAGTHIATTRYKCAAEVDSTIDGAHWEVAVKCGDKRVDMLEELLKAVEK